MEEPKKTSLDTVKKINFDTVWKIALVLIILVTMYVEVQYLKAAVDVLGNRLGKKIDILNEVKEEVDTLVIKVKVMEATTPLKIENAILRERLRDYEK